MAAVEGFQQGWVFTADGDVDVTEEAVVASSVPTPAANPQQLGLDLALPDEYGTKPMFD